MWRRVIEVAISLAIMAVAMAGCGGEKVFTADEFVADVNAEGAGLTLGPVFTTTPDGAEVRSVMLMGAELSPTGAEIETSGEGSLVILDDSEQASTEFERCGSTVSLTCFRAGNAVLRFEGLFPEEQARITASIQALASD